MKTSGGEVEAIVWHAACSLSCELETSRTLHASFIMYGMLGAGASSRMHICGR